MARPTKPKDIKPKAEGDAPVAAASSPAGGGGLDLKFIVTIVVIVICTSLTSAAAVYFLAPMVLLPALDHQLDKKLSKISAGGEGEAAAEPDGKEGGEQQKVGMNLELDEFTVNLKEDATMPGSQYLRAKMSLNISVPPEEDCYAEEPKKAEAQPYLYQLKSGKILGAALPVQPVSRVDKAVIAEGGADPKAACVGSFKEHMGKFVPTMRDVINAALMKRTAGMLATVEGQETLKDEIKESINQFMGEKYKVVRVNFEDFIIQK